MCTFLPVSNPRVNLAVQAEHSTNRDTPRSEQQDVLILACSPISRNSFLDVSLNDEQEPF